MLFSAVCGKRLQSRLINLKRFFVCLFLLLFLKKGGKAFSFYLLCVGGGGITMCQLVGRKEKV